MAGVQFHGWWFSVSHLCAREGGRLLPALLQRAALCMRADPCCRDAPLHTIRPSMTTASCLGRESLVSLFGPSVCAPSVALPTQQTVLAAALVLITRAAHSLAPPSVVAGCPRDSSPCLRNTHNAPAVHGCGHPARLPWVTRTLELRPSQRTWAHAQKAPPLPTLLPPSAPPPPRPRRRTLS